MVNILRRTALFCCCMLLSYHSDEYRLTDGAKKPFSLLPSCHRTRGKAVSISNSTDVPSGKRKKNRKTILLKRTRRDSFNLAASTHAIKRAHRLRSQLPVTVPCEPNAFSADLQELSSQRTQWDAQAAQPARSKHANLMQTASHSLCFS